MQKAIIGTLVGALILFAWHTLSWTVLPIHFQTFKYTPAQDRLLTTLDSTFAKSGAYILPTADNREGSYYDEEYQKEMSNLMENYKNKPKALIFFTKEGGGFSAGRMVWGFIFYLFSALIAVLFLIAAGPSLDSFFQRWWFVMLLPLLICLMGPLSDWNWLNYPWHYVKDIVFDQAVSWGLCGLWLAYWVK